MEGCLKPKTRDAVQGTEIKEIDLLKKLVRGRVIAET